MEDIVDSICDWAMKYIIPFVFIAWAISMAVIWYPLCLLSNINVCRQKGEKVILRDIILMYPGEWSS